MEMDGSSSFTVYHEASVPSIKEVVCVLVPFVCQKDRAETTRLNLIHLKCL